MYRCTQKHTLACVDVFVCLVRLCIPSAHAYVSCLAKPLVKVIAIADNETFTSQGPYTFIVNLMIPGPPHLNAVVYLRASNHTMLEGDTPFGRVWRKFTEGDDEERNSRFKLVPTIVEGSWVIKQVRCFVWGLFKVVMHLVLFSCSCRAGESFFNVFCRCLPLRCCIVAHETFALYIFQVYRGP